MRFEDADLPGFWRDADRASLAGQRQTLLLAQVRLGSLVVASLGGVLTWEAGRVDLAALMVAIGFLAALVVEVFSWVAQPERNWYAGRALAESAKTLAWRYATCADPFPDGMPVSDARLLLGQRFEEVSREARDRVTVHAGQAVVTPAMDILRASSFDERKAAYLEGRTLRQQAWYARKADENKSRATRWRFILVAGELAALGVAAARVFGGWEVDLAGLFAAAIASGAAWVALKQFTTLASAYSTTAAELAIQASRLEVVEQREWSLAVADAEEAISREHTLWLASRIGSLPSK